VFIRFPALGNSDPANDWKLAVDQGYEIQIDERSINPDTSHAGDPLHQTGAIYRLAPAQQRASRPVGGMEHVRDRRAARIFASHATGLWSVK
jgi:hypothetical protein